MRRRLQIVFTALLLLPLFLVVLAWRLNEWGKKDRAQPADAIIVFGARVHRGGQASPILRERTRHAFQLWKKGMAPLIVCTGGVGDNPPAEATVSRQLLEGWGVPSKFILVDDKSTSTLENVQNAATLLPKGAKVIGVSESFHLWRCRRNGDLVGLTIYTSPETNAWLPMPPLRRAHYCLREAIVVTRDLLIPSFS